MSVPSSSRWPPGKAAKIFAITLTQEKLLTERFHLIHPGDPTPVTTWNFKLEYLVYSYDAVASGVSSFKGGQTEQAHTAEASQ